MNILYFHTHDTGRIIKPYGYNIPTDNLMEFAKDATLFKSAFSAAPTCSPSRASLLTGSYPHKNQMFGLAHRGFHLGEETKHLATFLGEKGYETVIAGIQHEQGHYYKNSIENASKLGYDKVLTADHSKYTREEDLDKWDEENVETLIKYLKERDKSKNFFMSCGLFATHRPYPLDINEEVVDKRYIKTLPNTFDNEKNREDAARFSNTAYNADKCFGKLVEALKELGIYDETLIIFTTDHGVANPTMKCTLNDTGTGVSLIMRNPKSKNKGEVVENLISQVDVYPTICDIIGVDKPGYLDGRSFNPLFEDGEYEENEYVFTSINFHTSYEPARAIRNKRYKYVRYYDESYLKYNFSNIDESDPKTLLMENGLKEKTKDREQLFDLYFDPNEKTNLVEDESYKEVLERLRADLKSWQERNNDPLLKGELAYPKDGKVNKKECLVAGSKNVEDYEVHPDK